MSTPMWYIRNMIYPHGARTAKHPNTYWPDPEVTRRHHSHGPMRGFAPQQPSLIVFDKKGNLDDHEYQFFIGKPWEQSCMAVCRACHVSFYSTTDRKLHFKSRAVTYSPNYTPSCAVKTICVMQLLQKDDMCVVCDRKSRTRKWGFPLCSKPCTEAWMFAERHWNSFDEALKVAERQGWK